MAEQVKATLNKQVRPMLAPIFGTGEEAAGQMVIMDLEFFYFFFAGE